MIYPECIPYCLLDWLNEDPHKYVLGANRTFTLLLTYDKTGYPWTTFRFVGTGADGLRHTTFFIPRPETDVADGLREWYAAAELPLPSWLEKNNLGRQPTTNLPEQPS